MNKINLFIIHTILLLQSWAALSAPSSSELPKDAQKILSSLPNQSLNFDFVLQQAYLSSDSYRAVEALKKGVDAPLLEANTPLDTYITLQGLKNWNENEPTSPFSATRSYFTQGKLRAQKLFFTGSTLSFELTHGTQEYFLPTISTGKIFETKGTLGLKQNLWKDFFGYATRAQLRAGEAQKEARLYEYYEAQEDWFVDVLSLYQEAWFLQNQLRAAESNLKRREKLLTITQIKMKRGTSEQPDFLQAQSAEQEARVSLMEVEQALNQIWRTLVTQLGFPPEWILINPKFIPLTFDDTHNKIQNSCGQVKSIPTLKEKSNSSKKLELQMTAAQENLRAAQNLNNPDLNLQAQLITNAVDTKGSQAFNDATKVDTPQWNVVLELNIPLFRYQNQAREQNALLQRDRMESLGSQGIKNIEIDWTDSCHNFFRLKESVEILKKSFEAQLKRTQLEEKRFELGRVGLMNIIQAGDDTTRTEIKLKQTQKELQMTAWKILKLKGDTLKKVHSLESKI